MVNSPDVIVIGSGAAGLAASVALAEAGRRVLVVEARGRIGGRIDTRPGNGGDLPIERGAEFIHGLPPTTWQAVRAAGLPSYEASLKQWRAGPAGLYADDLWEHVEEVLGRLERVGEHDMSFREFLAEHCGDLPLEHRREALRFIEGFNAADATQAGAQALRDAQRYSNKIQGDRAFRLFTGYGPFLESLRARLLPENVRFQFHTAVTAIRWAPGSVELSTVDALGRGRRRTLVANAVIVTLPLGILQTPAGEPGGIAWTPNLPVAKYVALSGLAMGSVVKVICDFREPFWERGPRARIDDIGFLSAPGELLPTWWTTRPIASGRITGWAGGPQAVPLRQFGKGQMRLQVCETLGRAFGVGPRRVRRLMQAFYVADWSRDVWSRGAYSYARVGGAGAASALAAPVERTLYFAGEATHAEYSGTVDGALESGFRAAHELLADR